MSKKAKTDEFEQMYKSLTRKKFRDLMMNMKMLNCALSHLTFECHRLKKDGSLQIPLVNHPEKIFKFQVFQHKITKEEILSVEIYDAETLGSH